MSEYFDCVKEYKNIYNYAIQAEEALETADSVYRLDTFFNELRKAEEAILNKLIKEYSVQTEDGLNLFGKIDLLRELNIIDEDSKNNFHAMRKGGNEGSHAGETMDTRSERNYFQEQKKRAEYLFKCLYVECCNFANEYMPNAASGIVQSSNATTSRKSSHSVNWVLIIISVVGIILFAFGAIKMTELENIGIHSGLVYYLCGMSILFGFIGGIGGLVLLATSFRE